MTLDTARALELAGQGRQLADVRAAARPEDPVVEALIMLAAVVEELVRMLERSGSFSTDWDTPCDQCGKTHCVHRVTGWVPA